MGKISKEELTAKIIEILQKSGKDLYTVTPKSVRMQLEKDLGISLLSQKHEIKDIAREEIEKLSREEESGSGSESESKSESKASESSSEEEVEKPKLTRACAPARKAPVKRKRKAAKGSNSDSDNDGDEDYKSKKSAKKSSNAPKKKTGFTRPYNLSPQLSALMGADSLPRHEVVKKVWAIIKERNLYDPKNKQFAICDAELMEVMKIKRFRTFGMLKYLKPHFLN